MKYALKVLVVIAFAQNAMADTYSFSCQTSDQTFVISEKRAIVYGSAPVVLEFPELDGGLMKGGSLNYQSEMGDVASFEITDLSRIEIVAEENNGPCSNPDDGYTHGSVTEKLKVLGNWYLNGEQPQKVVLTCLETQTWQGTCTR